MIEFLKEGRDYYLDEKGLIVFTEAYLKERGYCCKSKCRHCPYGFTKVQERLVKNKSL